MGKFLTGAAAALALAFVMLWITGNLPGETTSKASDDLTLERPDVPPLEFAYLDSERVDSYLGQAENGLARKEARARQIKKSVNAALSAGQSVTLGASGSEEQSTSSTVEPDAADRFYAFLRVLRAEPQADVDHSGTCNTTRSRKHWLGELDFQEAPDKAMSELECVGVGNFVRIDEVQLFLPPFAQALPRVRSANAFYGVLPTPRTPFTSPTQSATLRHALRDYDSKVGTAARMPFVGAPYGEHKALGGKVALFLPTEYRGITREPSLLTGAVTVVGKIVYIAPASQRPKPSPHRRTRPTPPAYIDYPALGTFGRALLDSSPVFRADLGVCSRAPTLQTRAQAPLRSTLTHTTTARVRRAAQQQAAEKSELQRRTQHKARRSCQSKQRMLDAVKKAVSFRPPLVIVLPLAIYE